eukprot:COSAG02_NODE_16178_length_1106_cov_6.448858_2_plen_39_part_00
MRSQEFGAAKLNAEGPGSLFTDFAAADAFDGLILDARK